MDQFRPDWVSPPGDTILSILEERRITRDKFAKAMGLNRFNADNLIDSNIEITADLAELLSKVLGSTPKFWMKREIKYRSELKRLGINHGYSRA